MLGSTFFEVQSGSLFNQVVFVVCMFGIYIAREVWENGWTRMRLQGTVAVFVFMSGECMVRGWVWWWRHLNRIGQDASWMNDHPVLLIGASLQMVGAVLIVRVFAPDHWNKNIWWASVVVSVAMAAVVVHFN